MTKLLKQAFVAASQMSEVEQDDIARLVLTFIENAEPEAIPLERAVAVAEGLAQAKRGEFASDYEVETALKQLSAVIDPPLPPRAEQHRRSARHYGAMALDALALFQDLWKPARCGTWWGS